MRNLEAHRTRCREVPILSTTKRLADEDRPWFGASQLARAARRRSRVSRGRIVKWVHRDEKSVRRRHRLETEFRAEDPAQHLETRPYEPPFRAPARGRSHSGLET